MVCLPRNLTTLTIQDQLPQPSDMSKGAAVSRIKFYRNEIAHSDSGTMSDSEFTKTFDEVSMAIEIIYPPMKRDCKTLTDADIDHSVHDIYLEFVKMEKQMEEMKQQQEELVAQVKILNVEKQNIESIQAEEISDWKKKLEKFYVTEASTRLIEVVKNNQCMIITGVPGSGKSSLAYYVAMYMEETEGYTVLPIWLPSELIKTATSNAKQLFVFDDVFGKYSLNESNLNSWESEKRHMTKLLKNKTLKVIVTCRSYLFDNFRDSLSFQSFELFNLQSDGMNLSLSERKEISKLYLTDDVVSHLNDETFMMYNFFPLLCVMYKENNMDNADFFQNPNKFIENEIENFKKRKDVSFIALALLVLSNNSIEKEGLQIGKDKYDSMLQDLFDEMDTRTLSKTAILLSLHNLKNMYLEETEFIFCTTHDKIFDIITHTVGHYILRCILRHGTSTFVSSRCQLNSLNEKHGDSTIMITDELQPIYFERILKDIEQGHTWEVFASIQMKFEKFRVLFMLYLDKSSANFSSSDTEGTTALHVTASKGYFYMSKYLLGKNRKLIFSLDSRKNSPLHFASSYGHHELAKLFLSNDADVDLINSDECTPLLHSSLNGHVQFTKVLLEHHANVNRCTTSHSWSALHFGADDGNIDLIKLLVKHKANVNFQKINGMTALYIGCNSGHFNTVQLLIENKGDVNKCENEGWSPLHVACYKGFYDIAEILIINGADVNIVNNTGQTPLHFACYGNYIDIVKLLLQHGSRIDKGGEDENTPLFITCSNGYGDIVELLCEFIKLLVKHKAIVNVQSTNGMTPLYAACDAGNFNAVKLLIESKADVNKCENEEWSPLSVACYKGFYDIAKILIINGADLNKDNNIGQTPLHYVCGRNHIDVVQLLLHHGSETDKSDQNKKTPLHIT